MFRLSKKQILELVKEGKTAQEIYKIDKALGSLATLYRRIDKMKKEGIIDEKPETHNY